MSDPLIGWVRLLALKESCCSVAIETGQDWRELFAKALAHDAGVSQKHEAELAKSIFEMMKKGEAA